MDLRICKRCNSLYNTSFKFCPKCLEEIEEEFVIVRRYLFDHPNISIEELSEATDVDEKTILYLMKDGRLEYSHPSTGLKCEMCGQHISKGKMCDQCSDNLALTLSNKRNDILGTEGTCPNANGFRQTQKKDDSVKKKSHRNIHM